MTGIEVAKIDPSLDRSLFNSLKSTRKGSSSVAITSMIRPNTARRNPGGTLNLLRKIKQKYGSAVDVRIFGCSDEELDQLEQARGFDFVNFGELNRAEVAEVLRGADIFLDLSASQALNSIANYSTSGSGFNTLESMATPCSVNA